VSGLGNPKLTEFLFADPSENFIMVPNSRSSDLGRIAASHTNAI
jgi:hypothetical protein